MDKQIWGYKVITSFGNYHNTSSVMSEKDANAELLRREKNDNENLHWISEVTN